MGPVKALHSAEFDKRGRREEIRYLPKKAVTGRFVLLS